MQQMEFRETTVFTKRVTNILSDEAYAELQNTLRIRPDAGAVIRGSGGIRKLRWKTESSGKRGGLRIIYYCYVSAERIYMLYLYKKNEQQDLTPRQIHLLRQVIEED